MIAGTGINGICPDPLLLARSRQSFCQEPTPKNMLVGLDVELFRVVMLQMPSAARTLSTVSEQSVFTYLEQQRANPSQELD